MISRLALGVLVALSVGPAAAAASPQIRVKPRSIYPGEVVRVYGSAGGCEGNEATLISRAFSKRKEFAGVPAIFARVSADGRFSRRTRIPRRRVPGLYGIDGRCGGGNLGVTARLRVRAERRCGNVRVNQALQPAADGDFGAFRIRTRRTGCSRARRLASRYVREPETDPSVPRRIGHWLCKSRTVNDQVQRVRCTLGSRRVGFRNVLPGG